jgi:hypothetical protein
VAGKLAAIVHDVGGYLRGVFGEVPADLVGVLGGAWKGWGFPIRQGAPVKRRAPNCAESRIKKRN